MKKIGLFLAFIGILMLYTGCGQVTQDPTSEVSNLVSAQKVSTADAGLRKIVVFDQSVAPSDQEVKIKKHGAAIIKPLKLINAQVVTLPEQASDKAKAAILKEKGVIRIDDDIIVTALPKPDKPDKPDKPGKPTPPQPDQEIPWGITRIGAEIASNNGSGVKVAVLDTGIDLSHPDLNVAGGINYVNTKKSPNDDNGHGTHCAGIIAALDNTIGVRGVAPGVSLYAVKVLNRSGTGWLSDIILGLEWCINNNIDVVSMSFGSNYDNQSEQDAITEVFDAGIIMVAAAGNDYDDLGPNPVDYPAHYAEVIAVSATDFSNNIAYFSDRGEQIELAAPGVNIYSTFKGSSYITYSGTSMATPHVAGVAALAIGAGASDVRTLLRSTADDLGDPGFDTLYGYGLVDAEEASQ